MYLLSDADYLRACYVAGDVFDRNFSGGELSGISRLGTATVTYQVKYRTCPFPRIPTCRASCLGRGAAGRGAGLDRHLVTSLACGTAPARQPGRYLRDIHQAMCAARRWAAVELVQECVWQIAPPSACSHKNNINFKRRCEENCREK